MVSLNLEFSLFCSKNKCARTDNVCFSIFDVCTRGMTLLLCLKPEQKLLIWPRTFNEIWIHLSNFISALFELAHSQKS